MSMVELQPSESVFNLWARVYDVECNPLLLLEERTATATMPDVGGRSVLDVGCGTGRWLHRLEKLQPKSLIGLDCSAEMLEVARRKCGPQVLLLSSDVSSFPVLEQTQDLVMCSFVLSYLEDVPKFAQECARVIRTDGYLLISDVHPATAEERGWVRSFHSGGKTVHLKALSHSLSEIVSTFEAEGFVKDVLLEPCVGVAEQAIFEQAGMLKDFQSIKHVPAIYLLKMKKNPGSLSLNNTSWSNGLDGWNTSKLLIKRGLVASTDAEETEVKSLDLSGFVLLPGLVNAHDHLEFALFPNLGRGSELPAYGNATEWAEDIHKTYATTIEQHRKVPLEIRLWWGAIRNLLSGVTTVCHHNPLHSELLRTDFPVNVVRNFEWAHSLAFDEHMRGRFSQAHPKQPFIVHAGEGVDAQSEREVRLLDKMALLDRRTVLVHGLALTLDDVSLLNLRGSSVVLCPTSNQFLFHKSPGSAVIHSLDRVALGSDSPLTAAGDLLDEVHYLNAQRDMSAHSIYEAVTSGAAGILQLEEGEGFIRCGGRADLIAVKSRGMGPAATLANLSFADVEMVLLAGVVKLASAEIYDRLPPTLRDGLHFLEMQGHRRWIRADVSRLFEEAEKVLGRGNLRLGGKEVHLVSTV